MTDAGNRARDVERYEQLRSQALDGGPSGFRLGLALLERRGVAAWSRAARATAREPQKASTAAVVELPASGRELVGALADMALARAAAG
jgi:ATP phosphoribosyltransferase regulatory subunit HisZ